MKTTLNLNDQVLRSAKGRAARDGITLTRFVEDALRARLTDVGSRKPAFRLRLETVTGDGVNGHRKLHRSWSEPLKVDTERAMD